MNPGILIRIVNSHTYCICEGREQLGFELKKQTKDFCSLQLDRFANLLSDQPAYQGLEIFAGFAQHKITLLV